MNGNNVKTSAALKGFVASRESGQCKAGTGVSESLGTGSRRERRHGSFE
jgi:hypothetical protein